MSIHSNQVMTSAPADSATRYALETPPWLRTTVRVLMLAMGLALVLLSARSWGEMPLSARALVAVLSPAMVGIAIWSRPWRRLIKFVASDAGIAFPDNAQLVVQRDANAAPSWLLVPWDNISNIRLSREASDGNRCVAFDVRATADEREQYFRHVDQPKDSVTEMMGRLSVAYGDSPPSQQKTHDALLSLKAKHESRFRS